MTYIEKAHRLYLATKKRSEDRQKTIYDILLKIVNADINRIEYKSFKKSWKIRYHGPCTTMDYYFIVNMKHNEITYDRGSCGLPTVKDEKKDERRDKLVNYLTDSSFDLGNELHEATNLKSYLHEAIFEKITEHVSYRLSSRFSDLKDYEIPKVVNVELYGTEYIAIKRDGTFTNFDLIKNPENEPIKIWI